MKEKYDEKKKHSYLIFLIQTLWSGFFYCMQLTALNVGSLSNDDGDGNESAKRQWVKGLFTWRRSNGSQGIGHVGENDLFR